MKILMRILVLMQLVLATVVLGAPPLPAGWRHAAWWDLGGRDLGDVAADFNGDGHVEIATVAVRDNRDIMGLLVWRGNAQGEGKWLVLNEQKIPSSMADFDIEAVTDDDHPSKSKLLYCLAARECMVFTWDDKAGSFKRGVQARKQKSKG